MFISKFTTGVDGSSTMILMSWVLVTSDPSGSRVRHSATDGEVGKREEVSSTSKEPKWSIDTNRSESPETSTIRKYTP